MTKIQITVDQEVLRFLVHQHLNQLLGCELTKEDVEIQVKTKQNYKAEWELGEFRAVVDKTI